MKRIIFSILILVMLFVSGCAAPAATATQAEPTQAPATAIPATDVAPTATTAAADAPTATTAAAANCTYGATLVSEDPQDGQQFKPGEVFKKTWTFKNSGTCVWEAANLMLTVANAAGDTMLSGGQTPAYRMDMYSNPKKTTVAVGETISVALDMQAPAQGGTYTQNWQLVDSSTNQGLTITYVTGTTGKNFYVQIVVPGASTGSAGGDQKLSVQIQRIEYQQGAQPCTANSQYNVSAKITGAANTEVSYTVSSENNGTPGAGETITLNDKGAYDIHTGITGPFSDPGNVQVTINVLINGQPVNYAYDYICQGGEYKQ
jgi:hypothetical protein